jgi:hypothetical protein
MPVSARHVNTERPASAPRPGRGLVIAGGVTLGVGVALTAAAGFMGRRMVDTRQQIIALSNSVDGYATTDQDARDDALRGDYRATPDPDPRAGDRGRRDRPRGRGPHQHRRPQDGPRRLAHRARPGPRRLVFHARF